MSTSKTNPSLSSPSKPGPHCPRNLPSSCTKRTSAEENVNMVHAFTTTNPSAYHAPSKAPCSIKRSFRKPQTLPLSPTPTTPGSTDAHTDSLSTESLNV